ncbi:MAG: MFS transporter [Actinomycetota bacterium]|nr:MFS transporter [Actinomycetota bacterium]
MPTTLLSARLAPRTRRPAPQSWTLVLVSIGAFMTALDTLVVTSALPVLRVQLHTSLSSLEWTVNAYNLAFACLLLTGAALGDRFGRRRLFSIGLLVFTVASAAAALSPTAGALIAARAVQGAGAAIVTPLSLTLLCAAFPAEKRGSAIGLWGGIVGLAVGVGPVIGGAVVGGISWHWMFWINVPIGAALIPLARRRLAESREPQAGLDVAGVAIAAAGAFGVTWGLVRADTIGWTSTETVLSLTVGVAAIVAFVAWEHHCPNPMLPIRLFRSRGFAAANAVSFFMYAGLFGALFFMAQLLQSALGYSPLGAGLRLLPWTAPPLVIAPLAGKLADRYGNRPFMVAGLALQGGGLAWVAATVSPHLSYLALGTAFAVAGTGTSLCFPTVANAVMGSVPMQEVGVASGTNSVLRELGGVVGVTVLAATFVQHGSYRSPAHFVSGFTTAIWVAVALSAAGVIAALLTPVRQPDRTPSDAPNDEQAEADRLPELTAARA